MTDEPNPYDSPQEPSQATRPPRRTRWRMWVSLGLLLGAIAVGLAVHFYISLSPMPLIRHRLPEPELPPPVEESKDEGPRDSV